MTQLLQNAAYGTVLILAVAILRRVLKERLVPEARLALWAVCLFRLLTPAAPESALSLWGLGRLFGQEAPAPVPAAVPSGTGTFAPAAPAAAASVPAPVEVPWGAVLTAVWLLVGAALAARYAVSWARTRRAVTCAVPLDRSDPRYAPLPRCARLRVGPMEGAPLTFGVARPTVVLAPGLEGEELACVLAHEGVHARRRDNLWHYVMALALVVHWWNPAVWLMSRLLRRDIELSCDRAAVRKLGENRRADYAQALVSLATQGSGPDFCNTFGRKAAEERILSVMKFKKMSIIGVVFTLALVLAVTAAFASNPKQPSDTIEYHGHTYNRADLSQETLDWLDWYFSLSEEGQLSVSMVPPELIPGLDPAGYDAYPSEGPDTVNIGGTLYDVKLPTSDENGDPEDNGIIGQRMMELDEYKALLDSLVAGGEMSQADADGLYTGAKQALENGSEALALYATGRGSYAVMNAPLCGLPDCVDYEPHSHDSMRYSGHTTSPCTFMDCENCNYHVHGDVHYLPTLPVCTLDDCGNNTVHDHDGILYKGWTGKSTLPPAPAVVPEPCTVTGCTISGTHTHDGVTYTCNGYHSGGHCDGTCNHHSDPAPACTPAGGHHSESHNSGHHGNGHH